MNQFPQDIQDGISGACENARYLNWHLSKELKSGKINREEFDEKYLEIVSLRKIEVYHILSKLHRTKKSAN